jgi:hypothetical protein
MTSAAETIPAATSNFQLDVRTVLREVFASHGLAVGEGHDGDILVPFEHEGRRLLVAARAGESPAAGMWLQLIAADPIPREHWGAALVAVNRWNALVPCPRAVLRGTRWDEDEEGTLTLDVWMPFGDDAPPDRTQIDRVAATVLASVSFFAEPAASGASRADPGSPA